MARWILGIALLLGSIGLHAETRRVTDLDISEVRVFGSVEVEISQGDTPELLLRGKQSDLDKEPFYIRGNTLFLGDSQTHPHSSFSGVKYKLTISDLRELRLAGSGDVFVRPMQLPKLEVSIEGSGNVKLFSLKAGAVDLRISGSGDIQLAEVDTPSLEMLISGSGDIAVGKTLAKSAEATITGSGDISVDQGEAPAMSTEIRIIGGGTVDLSGLDTHTAEVSIIGSGDATVGTVDSWLKVQIVGSGDIYYSGDPKIDSTILGAGDLNRRRK